MQTTVDKDPRMQVNISLYLFVERFVAVNCLSISFQHSYNNRKLLLTIENFIELIKVHENRYYEHKIIDDVRDMTQITYVHNDISHNYHSSDLRGYKSLESFVLITFPLED
jgi:hypothetical protein